MSPLNATAYRQAIAALAEELCAAHEVRPPLVRHPDCRVCYLIVRAADLVDVRPEGREERAAERAVAMGETAPRAPQQLPLVPGVAP